ncbi:MAG: flagellar hook basal-body protein [Desulfosalsimonas sp.]
MGTGLYSELSGGLAEMRQMETAVHDLANANKTGYKAGGMAFESMVDGNMQNTGANGMNFCRTSNRFIDFSQGDLKQTGRSLDMAIKGDGFFKVAGDDGFFYTRAGDFTVDDQGNLVTSAGRLQVVGEDGPVNLPHTDVEVDSRGRITSDGEELGRLDVYTVAEPQDLIQRPDGLYEADGEAGEEPAGNGARVVQGSLEQSNASALELSTGLIETQRAYEAYLKNMKTHSDLGEQAARIGRVG